MRIQHLINGQSVDSHDTLETVNPANQQVLAEIARYPVPDIVVVGHTDLVGSDQVNDVLAKKRAQAVEAILVGRGIGTGNIVAIGRGKREPAVPTAEGVAEPRNRRVEIVVR
jgi:outer membrane protein OmpA-like peptidoglycan-associated protein